MTAKINRPPIVWLAQILLVVFFLLQLSIILLNIAVVLRNGVSDGVSIIHIFAWYSVLLAFLLLLFVAFWGLAKRRIYGRWLGVLSLTLMWALIIVSQLLRPSGPYKYYEYENSTQVVGAVIGAIVFHSLCLAVILRLAFSKRVSEFLRSENDRTTRFAKAE